MARRTKNKVDDNPLDKSEVADAYKLERVYKETDKEYFSFLQQRLERAKTLRNEVYPEFNNKTYQQYFDENEKIANTHHLDPKKNPDDVVVSAGTIEQKLDSLLSHINNLNLSCDVYAFDRENNRVNALGVALEDIIYHTEIRDGGDGAGDEEKKLIRQRELLKQGTVFVQEEWLKKYEIKKKLNQEYNGEFANFAGYSEQLVKVFDGPSRTKLYGPNVYMGDLTKFYIEDQPYIFVAIKTGYQNAKSKYGKFENWKYVQPGALPTMGSSSEEASLFDMKWRLFEMEQDEVEIILYYDKPRDEFQIIVNGVALLPVGFPMSAVCPRGEYNIAKQTYRILNDKFAYGGAFVSSGSVKEISSLIDEMLKLFVLKTRKSFTPAYVNTSGRVIDRKVLTPGRISMGIDPQALVPIAGNEVQGITAGEVGLFDKFQGLIDKSTVSDQFTGQSSGGTQTATEVLELQRQARLTLGLTIVACALLEKKLGYLRLYNILQNWFEPYDTKVQGIEDARELIRTYRKTTRDVSIPGEGPGERSVIPQDEELPSADVIRGLERKEEKERGMPIRKIFLNPTELKAAGILWYLVVNTKERESSPFFKLIFREMLSDMLTLLQFGSVPNKDGLEEEFARVWGKPRNKLFSSTQVPPEMAGASMPDDGSNLQPSGRRNQAGLSPSLPGGLAAGVGNGL